MKPFPARPTEGEVHLWLLTHGQGNLAHLSSVERTRCQSYRLKKDRDRYAFTQSAKRQILGGYLHQAPSKVTFRENQHGKPSVEGLEFNISHTEGFSLLALTKETAIGVDIEALKPQTELTELVERICSESEKNAFSSLSRNEELTSFYRLWTAKEAYLKGLGIGFEIEPNEVETSFPDLSSCQAKDRPTLVLLEYAKNENLCAHLAFEDSIRHLHQFNFPD